MFAQAPQGRPAPPESGSSWAQGEGPHCGWLLHVPDLKQTAGPPAAGAGAQSGTAQRASEHLCAAAGHAHRLAVEGARPRSGSDSSVHLVSSGQSRLG